MEAAHRAAVAALPPGWPHTGESGVAKGAHGMVASDATLANLVGSKVLAEGGNAVDAAVATAFALAVVHPAAGNIGGGGFMVARMGAKPYALDFRETAPAKATRDLYIGPDGKATNQSREGILASGTPGSVAGLFEAHRVLGSKSKPWKTLIMPAVELAERGFLVESSFAKAIRDMKDRLSKNPASAALFLPGGEPPAEGSTWKNPELGAVLRRIADVGPSDFYTGETSRLLVGEMNRTQGLVSAEDLANYKAKWRTPIEFDYRGMHLVSMPPPSSGGVTLAMICHLLEGYDLAPMPWHSAEEVHLVAESMRRAFAARNARLGDPDFVENPVAWLMGDGWARAQRATITPGKATPSSSLETGGPPSGMGPHTTHFSVVDGSGNAVALTTTINWWFGNSITVPGGGFLLNNEMDDFAAKPGSENGYGLVQGEPNAVAPNKRMLSSMTPTIVVDRAGKVQLVLGAAGGPTIITSVFQTLSNMVDHHMPVEVAVHAPRIHHQHFPDTIVIEKGGMPADVRTKLEGFGHSFKERDHIADAPAIGTDGVQWIGVSEPRRPGTRAAGW
jgi:gamma-glutamyltranspeptidase/glutathione hydrolase